MWGKILKKRPEWKGFKRKWKKSHFDKILQ